MELSPILSKLVEQLVELTTPQRIILFSQKTDLDGQLSSCKLCVVTEMQDRHELLRQIYRQTDCDVPFDVVLYTPEEWSRLCDNGESFACRVAHNGQVLYE